jgi:methionyl-tRNA formyltransferase
MAPLPEYRGCNQFSYAIIDGVDTFGVTIHQINAGIDSGDIIFEDRFPIERDVWVKDLYEITYAKSIELFKNSLGNIVSGDFKRSRQEDFLPSRCSAFYKRSDIEKLKRVSLLWDKEKIERHIRATLMPGFEPPYIEIEGRKIFLSESYSNG